MEKMSNRSVYNIRKVKYSDSLSASGVENRWNKRDEFVLYTAGSRALSILELMVHRAHLEISIPFVIMNISLEIENNDIQTVHLKNLPSNWKSIYAYGALQKIGSDWYQKRKKLILKVPSVIVPREYNYLIHTKHQDFLKKVKLIEREKFEWDERLV